MDLFISFITISLILVAIVIIAAKLHIIEGIITPAFWGAYVTMFAAFLFLLFYILDLLYPITLEELQMPLLPYLWAQMGKTAIFALIYFSGAVASGFMILVSNWIEDDEKASIFKFMVLFFLLLAAIFAIGFFKFFEGVALILGIIGTIIGIFIGLKKLSKS